MQHKISECRTGIRATKSPALELYLAESKYTNLATKKSNDNRCTHALAAVSDVALPLAQHVEVGEQVGELSSADLAGEGHDGALPDRP